jgi:AcrR family transcriptional regulator
MSADEQAKRKNDLVRDGFVQAAKQIIHEEGVGAVSVRKIAKATGYSYATIYHYFTDLDALLLAVKEQMVEDVAAHFSNSTASAFQSIDDLKRANRDYAQYYLDRPNVYYFFYTYRFAHEPMPDYDARFQENWLVTYRVFVEKGILRQEDVVTAAKTMIYALQGLLALYFSSNGVTRESFFQDMDNIVDYLFVKES